MADLKDSKINQAVARRLRELRAGEGLSLEQIADLSGVPLSTVRRIFAPKQDIATSHLTAIAGALGTNARDVFAYALEFVGEKEAIADVYRILDERNLGRVSEADATVTELHPRDMTVEQLEEQRHAAKKITRESTADEPEGP